MNALIEQLLGSPALPDMVSELQTRLVEERARRERFYEEFSNGVKAEFINGKVIVHMPSKHRHTQARHFWHELLEMLVRIRGLGVVGGEKSLCVFPRHDYGPGGCLFGKEKAAGICAE